MHSNNHTKKGGAPIPPFQRNTYMHMYLEVRKLLLYFWSLLTVSLNLILELFLSPHLATAVHPVVDCLINLIGLTIVSFVGCRGKQTSTVACKLKDGGRGGGVHIRHKMGGRTTRGRAHKVGGQRWRGNKGKKVCKIGVQQGEGTDKPHSPWKQFLDVHSKSRTSVHKFIPELLDIYHCSC